jgi:hypothetical protein
MASLVKCAHAERAVISGIFASSPARWFLIRSSALTVGVVPRINSVAAWARARAPPGAVAAPNIYGGSSLRRFRRGPCAARDLHLTLRGAP